MAAAQDDTLTQGANLSLNAPAEKDTIETAAPANTQSPKTSNVPPIAPAGKQPAQPDAAANSFIRVSGNTFVDNDCREFFYTGWNGFNELLKAGLKVPPPGSLAAAPELLASQSDFATTRFAEAAASKLSVTRVFAAGGDGQGIQLQPQPGRYDEKVFRGIDYILAQAARYNIKVVLSIINNWDKIDGKGQYAEWAGVGPDQFWTDPKARSIYKAHLKALTNRVNVFTGTAYKNDPTIFSWNLCNEPRNPDVQPAPGKPQPVTAWVNEMSAVLAALDANHMITVGEEGFYVAGGDYAKYNPYNPRNPYPTWASNTGQDFLTQHSSPDISYAAFHYWPDNWDAVTQPTLLAQWMDSHITAARQLQKPLVLEEFGKVAATDAAGDQVISGPEALQNITATRDPMYSQVYEYVDKNLNDNGPLRAALFWQWDAGQRSSARGVLSTDSTFKIITAHGSSLAKLPRSVQPNCSPR